jgi:hypothetical protein
MIRQRSDPRRQATGALGLLVCMRQEEGRTTAAAAAVVVANALVQQDSGSARIAVKRFAKVSKGLQAIVLP